MSNLPEREAQQPLQPSKSHRRWVAHNLPEARPKRTPTKPYPRRAPPEPNLPQHPPIPRNPLRQNFNNLGDISNAPAAKEWDFFADMQARFRVAHPVHQVDVAVQFGRFER
ncbi:hypothetical protein CCANI_08150 [Corynebacterium canis]|nr:hypothetical protein CCANI_08150 [Corynebacterium canis]